MHCVGDKDTADVEAQARREAGLSRQLEQTQRVLPHPQKCGISGYPVWYRAQQLEREQHLQHVDMSADHEEAITGKSAKDLLSQPLLQEQFLHRPRVR